MAFLKERTFSCLVLVALLMLGATMARPLFPMREIVQSGLNSRVFWSLKKYEFKNANILTMGSSCTYRGISPDDMGLHLNSDLIILNFGFSAGSLNPFMFQKADAVLAKDAGAFKAVLLEISPIVFKKAVTRYQKIKRRDSRYQSSLEFEPLNVRLFKVYFDERKGLQYQHCYPNGWMASNSDQPAPNLWVPPKRKRPSDQQQMVQKYAGICLDQVRKWRKQGVWVFGYQPYTPCIENWDYNYDFDSGAYRKRFEKSGGIWLDVNRQDLFCYDGVHLNEKSARIFSKRLGEAIAERLKALGLQNYVR